MPCTLIERVPERLGRPGRASRPSRPEGANPTLVLAIILATYLMIILDATIVITALPQIHRSLGFSSTGLSWVQNAYTLAFGGLLLLGARAGDILGRRRVFVAGIALFTLASLLGGLAPSATWLLAARAVQGIGAAIAAPSTLALLQISFREGPERARAIGAYSAVAGAGGSVGLVLGGMLTSWVSWRWGLFINVPIGVALVLLAPRYLPESERRHGRFDLAGAATSTLGMTSLVYGFVRAGSAGWGNRVTLASFVAGAALLGVFALTEKRAEQPITPLHLFASRERAGAYGARMLLVSGMFAMFFFVTQFLQGVRGYSALGAGLAFLPVTAVMFGAARTAPKFAPRVGNTRLLIAGVFLAMVGMAWLSRISAGTPYFPDIAVPMLLLGLGIGTAMTPLTTAGMAGVEPEDAGAASGVVNVSQQLGGSLGLGILVTVFAAASRAAVHHSAGAPVAQQARLQLAHGVATSLRGSALFLALALGVAVLVMRRPTQREAESVVETVAEPAMVRAATVQPMFPPVRVWAQRFEDDGTVRHDGATVTSPDFMARGRMADDERKCS
ncbi:MAG TPA: MFS transporter [Acidimicrobiales bacterium]|nr:MFS transporter [Acidimicrobiales bacterium]